MPGAARAPKNISPPTGSPSWSSGLPPPEVLVSPIIRISRIPRISRDFWVIFICFMILGDFLFLLTLMS